MGLDQMTLKDVLERLAKLDEEVRSMANVKDVDAAAEEKKALLERKKELEDLEARKQTALDLQSGKIEGKVVEERGRENMAEKIYNVESAEYRSAWLKKVRGQELTEVEKRAMSTAANSVGAAVPVTTVNKIIEKVKDHAPLLNEIELLAVPGGVKIPAEGTTADAQLHKENAKITADDDTLTYVELSAYEVTKLVTISKSVEKMSIDAFENWLTDKIATKVAEKIMALILDGTGTNQPQGINAIRWDENNSATVAKDAKVKEADVQKVCGLLKGSYFKESTWYMNTKTFFGEFHPLMNSSKNNVVTLEGGVYRIMGRPVEFEDNMKDGEAILGDLKKGYIGNMPEDVTITSQFVTRENAYDFLGCAMFDGKVQAVEAFVKIVKATV